MGIPIVRGARVYHPSLVLGIGGGFGGVLWVSYFAAKDATCDVYFNGRRTGETERCSSLTDESSIFFWAGVSILLLVWLVAKWDKGREIPKSLERATGCLLAYSSLMIFRLLLSGLDIPIIGVIRILVSCVWATGVAVFLLRLQRWAWWLALIGSLVLVLQFSAAVPALFSLWQAAHELQLVSIALEVGGAIALVTGLVLLLTPRSRRSVF